MNEVKTLIMNYLFQYHQSDKKSFMTLQVYLLKDYDRLFSGFYSVCSISAISH